MTELKNDILEQIETGTVAMRPRWHFVLQTALYTTGVILTVLVSVYLVSFIFFILAKTGLGFAPLFGLGGIMFFIVTSPWLLIITTGIFLMLVALAVKHYAFSYRHPLIYSLLGVVGFVLITSGLIHQTALHDRIEALGERNNLPGLAPLYRDATDTRPREITPGTVVAIDEASLTIKTPEAELYTVVVSPKTRGVDITTLTPGTNVIIFGERSTSTIAAKGVRVMKRDFPPLRPR